MDIKYTALKHYDSKAKWREAFAVKSIIKFVTVFTIVIFAYVSFTSISHFKKVTIEDEPQNPWVFDIDRHREKIYSQGEQDGVLQYIFKNIGTTNRYFVEFGFDAPEWGGIGPNTKLLHVQGWKGLELDGRFENEAMNLHKHFIYPSNIVNLFDKYRVPREADYVSIDLDSTDVHILRSILTTKNNRFNEPYRPRVISIEFNHALGPNSTLAFPNAEFHQGTQHQWDITCYMGSSAGSIKMVAEAAGYTIVYRLGILDLFLVRNDLLDDATINELKQMWGREHPFTWDGPLHNPLSVEDMASWIDYETWLETGDSVKAAQRSWEMIWKDYRPALDNEGWQQCFGKAWKTYENKYGEVPMGEVPEMKTRRELSRI